GVIPNLDRRYKQTESEGIREEIEAYMSTRICPDCHGARLKPEALAVTVGGYNIVQVTRLSIVLTQRFFQDLETLEFVQKDPLAAAAVVTKKKKTSKSKEDKEDEVVSLLGDPLAPIDPDGPLVKSPLSTRDKFIARQILKEIRTRLQFLIDVGLDYLTINRAATTLSGGEAQRIRLATQIGSGLMGVLYILDEPSIGL